jgi:hypothetical protein
VPVSATILIAGTGGGARLKAQGCGFDFDFGKNAQRMRKLRFADF